jgi:hypothetical protein
MTSILKADNIQDADGNNIINESSNTITIGASGDTISIPSGATFNINGTAGTGIGTNTPNFRAKVTADTDITNNTLVKVIFPSEDYDTASAYDTSTGKFTVPSGQGGKYFIYSQLFLNSGADSELIQSRVIVYKNGSLLRSTENEYAANNLRRVSLTLTTVEDLSASDYLEIYTVIQDSSGTPNLYNTTGNPNFFGAFKIIE